jgi:hypothetical protein
MVIMSFGLIGILSMTKAQKSSLYFAFAFLLFTFVMVIHAIYEMPKSVNLLFQDINQSSNEDNRNNLKTSLEKIDYLGKITVSETNPLDILISDANPRSCRTILIYLQNHAETFHKIILSVDGFPLDSQEKLTDFSCSVGDEDVRHKIRIKLEQ